MNLNPLLTGIIEWTNVINRLLILFLNLIAFVHRIHSCVVHLNICPHWRASSFYYKNYVWTHINMSKQSKLSALEWKNVCWKTFFWPPVEFEKEKEIWFKRKYILRCKCDTVSLSIRFFFFIIKLRVGWD